MNSITMGITSGGVLRKTMKRLVLFLDCSLDCLGLALVARSCPPELLFNFSLYSDDIDGDPFC